MDLTSIFTGIGAAFAVGFAQAVIGPLVEWHVEQKRKKKQRKRELIQDWREMIRDVWRNGRVLSQMDRDDGTEVALDKLDSRYELLDLPIVAEMLKSDERYFSLRSRMRDSKREEIESGARGGMIGDTVMPESLSIVNGEIDRLESEWGLVDEHESDSGRGAWWKPQNSILSDWGSRDSEKED